MKPPLILPTSHWVCIGRYRGFAKPLEAKTLHSDFDGACDDLIEAMDNEWCESAGVFRLDPLEGCFEDVTAQAKARISEWLVARDDDQPEWVEVTA